MRKKPTRDPAALGSPAAPSASTQRNASCSLPPLPKGPTCQQLTDGWLTTASPGQTSAVYTLPFTWHTIPVQLTGDLAPPGSGMRNPASKPRRLLPLHWAVTKSSRRADEELKFQHLLARTDSHGNAAHCRMEPAVFLSLCCY